MKKKSIITIGTSLAMLFGLFMGTTGNAMKTVGVKAAVPSGSTGTLSTSFKQEYNNLTSAADSNYYKNFDDGATLKMYSGEDVSPYYTAKVNKYNASENPKVRNYHNEGTTYYLYLKYCSAKTANTEGSNMVFSPVNDAFRIKSISSNACYTPKSNLGIYSSSDNTNWTLVSHGQETTSGFSYTFDTSVKYVKLAHYYASSDWLILTDVTISYETVSASYDLSYDSTGGTSIATQHLASNEVTVKPTDPVKPSSGTTAYEFLGWFDEETGGNEFTFGSTIYADTTLYAHWQESEAQTFTMDFVTNGDGTISQISTLEGTKFTKPTNPVKTPTKTDRYQYTFDGWYTEAELTNAYDWDTLASENLTLYGKFTRSYVDMPSGTNTYSLTGGVKADTTSWNYNYTLAYSNNLTLDSYNTFDQSKANPEISLGVEATAIASGNGIIYQSYWSPLFKNAKVTLSAVDHTKTISYIRIIMAAWSSESYDIDLFANDSTTACDTEASTVSGAESRNCLQASFDASDAVTSVNFTIPSINVCIRDIYIGYVNSEAATWAQTFLDTELCYGGSTAPNATNWGTLSSSFSSLSANTKAILKAATADAGGDVIEQAMARYDLVVSKYSSETYVNFIDRTPSVPTTNSIINTIDDSALIVLIISTVSLMSILSFVAYRKKKISK